jgi:hypothetical protein
MPENRMSNFIKGEKRSVSDEWYTPPRIIHSLGKFDLDPACGEQCPNRTARRRFSEQGLERTWSGRVWLNPPFSGAKPWMEKLAEHGDGIGLVFARFDAKWLQHCVSKSRCFFMFHGRIAFHRPDGSAPVHCPLSCILVPFGEHNVEAIRASGLKGILCTDLETLGCQ